ncbi:hypothetical protein [Candidatus Amarobacter glycogenicus]
MLRTPGRLEWPWNENGLEEEPGDVVDRRATGFQTVANALLSLTR